MSIQYNITDNINIYENKRITFKIKSSILLDFILCFKFKFYTNMLNSEKCIICIHHAQYKIKYKFKMRSRTV